MEKFYGQFVLVFKREPTEGNGPVKETIKLWYMRSGLACFDPEEANKFYYKDEAEQFARTIDEGWMFQVEEISQDNGY